MVVLVRRDGRPLVLRLCQPDGTNADEARALRAWRGRGAVVLEDTDPDSGALLLERLKTASPSTWRTASGYSKRWTPAGDLNPEACREGTTEHPSRMTERERSTRYRRQIRMSTNPAVAYRRVIIPQAFRSSPIS